VPKVNRRRFALVTGWLATVALTSGCSLLPADYTLHVSNSTTLPLTLVVNDHQVAVLEPGTDADISSDRLPALPWSVATLTSTGRSVATMDVAPGSVVDQRAIDGTGSYSAPFGAAALSCGRVMLWVGNLEPTGGGYSEGVPGDCNP
jgi:hypothetical protein